MKIIVLGAPGAGKGTQAKLIGEKYNIPHISTGDIFRNNIKEGTPLGMEAKSYMDKGQLVPDDITEKMLLDRVSMADCKSGYVLDGFPRTYDQADALEKFLKERDEAVDYAIDINVPDGDIVERMSGRRTCPICGASYHIVHIPPKKEGICDECGSELVMREDDNPETVQDRLNVYHAQTQPLMDFYSERGILHIIDGTKDMMEVFETVTSVIG